MKDEDKTKEQLIQELAEMRTRNAELEELEHERKWAEDRLRRNAALDRVRVSVYEMREYTDIQRVLISLHEGLKDTGVDYDYGSVQIVNEERENFRIVWQGKDKVHYQDEEGPVELPLTGSAVYEAWRNKRPVYRRNLDKEDPYNERTSIRIAYEEEILSVLDVPFSYGTIALNSLQPDAFSERDIETLEMFASVLSEGYVRYMDITALKQAEEKNRQHNELLTNVIESLSHPFYVIDANDYTIKMANSTARALGLSEETTCYAATYRCSRPCEYAEHPCPLLEVKKTKKPVIVEHIHYDANANPRSLEIHGFPIFDSEGNVVQMIEYSLDITERKQAEEQIKSSLQEKEVLLHEIHHRVKNNMQVISSLLNLQEREIGDERLNEIFENCRNRISAMALVHDNLYRSNDLANINFSEYISSLASTLFQTYRTTGRIALKMDLEDISLSIDSAIPCGLILNELISNSLKHAFPGDREGEIRIDLCSDSDDNITLIVSNNGVEFPADLDFRNTESLGLQLVNILTQQLDGTIELDRSSGTAFKIRF